jgi:hypothetical protein
MTTCKIKFPDKNVFNIKIKCGCVVVHFFCDGFDKFTPDDFRKAALGQDVNMNLLTSNYDSNISSIIGCNGYVTLTTGTITETSAITVIKIPADVCHDAFILCAVNIEIYRLAHPSS